jgi:hypothetical protein
MSTTPRIEKVAVTGPTALQVKLRDGRELPVILAGWIGTGGDVLAPLKDPEVFATAHVAEHGTAVGWAEDDDLMIDAIHLEKLADEQKPFSTGELVAWQETMGISNREAADLLDIALSTWNLYRAGGAIPNSVGMVVRATTRDPILMQAHFRPRPGAGRPRSGEFTPKASLQDTPAGTLVTRDAAGRLVVSKGHHTRTSSSKPSSRKRG